MYTIYNKYVEKKGNINILFIDNDVNYVEPNHARSIGLENAIELAEKIGCIIQPIIINATKSILPNVDYQHTSTQVPVENILLALKKKTGIEPTQAKIDLLELQIKIYSGQIVPFSSSYKLEEKKQTAIIEKCKKKLKKLRAEPKQEKAESSHVQRINIAEKHTKTEELEAKSPYAGSFADKVIHDDNQGKINQDKMQDQGSSL